MVVLDPHQMLMQKLNQLFLLTCLVSLAMDPLFFYVLAFSKEQTCLYQDWNLAVGFERRRRVALAATAEQQYGHFLEPSWYFRGFPCVPRLAFGRLVVRRST